MTQPKHEKPRRDRADRQPNAPPAADPSEPGRAAERERATIRPEPPSRPLPGGGDVIR